MQRGQWSYRGQPWVAAPHGPPHPQETSHQGGGTCPSETGGRREFKKRELVPNPGVPEQGEEPGSMSAGVPGGRREPLSSLIHPGLHLTDEPALGATGTLGPYQRGQGNKC